MALIYFSATELDFLLYGKRCLADVLWVRFMLKEYCTYFSVITIPWFMGGSILHSLGLSTNPDPRSN